MIYQYDQALQLPTVQLYDTQIMAMALQAAKDMYDKGEQQIKDFQKAYGDFLTPITADQDWWNQNVTGRVRDAINQMYARGGDPLRNAQDRAQVAMLINNMPYGDMAKLRTSAENAREYQKERAKLEAAGLYNPMTEKYAGPGLDTFSTLDNGVWNRMSPVPYQNMSDFSKAYFEGIKPTERHAVKDGIQYTISEITPERLHQIADDHFNDLVNTPQGRLMYQMYKDQYGSDKAARNAFNNAVVSGNLRRIVFDDNFDTQRNAQLQLAISQENLKLKKEQIAIQRLKAENARKRQEAEDRNRWSTRQRNQIADHASMNQNDIDNLNELKKQASFNGARAALINENKSRNPRYNPTVAEVHARMNQAKQLLSGTTKEGIDYYSKNYRAQSTIPEGSDAKTAVALAAGFADAESTGDITGEKRRPLSFKDDGNLHITRERELAYANRQMTHNSPTNRLQRSLKKDNVKGYVDSDDNVTVNHRTVADGTSYWDVNVMMRVRKNDIKIGPNEEFKTEEELNNAIQRAGGSIQKRRSKVIVKNSKGQKMQSYADVDWVIIPVTRTVDPGTHTDSQIDAWHENQYGKKYGYESEQEFVDEDLMYDE